MLDAIKAARDAAQNEYVLRQTAWGLSNESIATAQKLIDESAAAVAAAQALIDAEKAKAPSLSAQLDAANKATEVLSLSVAEAKQVGDDLDSIIAHLTTPKA